MDQKIEQAAESGISKSELRYLYLAEIYRAVMTLLQDQAPSQLEETFRMALNSRPPYTEGRSLFSLAIQVYDKNRAEKTSKATRSLKANALEYALRHRKTPEEIPKFLSDMKGTKKAAQYARDPEMKHHWAMLN